VVGSCEHAPLPSCSVKVEKFPDYLDDYKLFKKGCIRWSYFAVNSVDWTCGEAGILNDCLTVK
jgi:hypothetical protein